VNIKLGQHNIVVITNLFWPHVFIFFLNVLTKICATAKSDTKNKAKQNKEGLLKWVQSGFKGKWFRIFWKY